MPDRSPSIPVYATRLPPAAALLPYLERIDASGTYSNRGPLVREYETRLAEALGLRKAGVVTAASGTAALHGAILATAGRATPQRGLALVPGYTFAATAHAAQACGFEPVFVDVDPDSWCMSAASLRDHPALPRVGLVLPVACHGRPHSQAEWAGFVTRTGIPVVIDGASSFEAIRADAAALTGSVPVAISLHATKTVSAAEGGAVVWADRDGLDRVTRHCNFGLTDTRAVGLAGFNGKMSEYHAAIGLASLDALPAIEAERQARGTRFAAAAARHGLAERVFAWPDIASNCALWLAPSRGAAEARCGALSAGGIGWRRWYGGAGLHREPHFAAPDRAALPVAEDIAARLIGIPCFAGIADTVIDATLSLLRCG